MRLRRKQMLKKKIPTVMGIEMQKTKTFSSKEQRGTKTPQLCSGLMNEYFYININLLNIATLLNNHFSIFQRWKFLMRGSSWDQPVEGL